MLFALGVKKKGRLFDILGMYFSNFWTVWWRHCVTMETIYLLLPQKRGVGV